MAKKAKSKKSTKKVTNKAAKKAKKTTKVAKSKASAAKKSTKARKPVTVPLHSVAKFMRHLIDEGRLDEFIAAVENSKAVVNVHPDDLKLAKTYMPAPDVIGQEAVAKAGAGFNDPCPGGDPFDCQKG